jgi:uncharacterized lipoprotein YehR (DUF1307 family)
MNRLTKLISFILAMVLLLSLFGCGKKAPNKGAKPVDMAPYLGTWQGSDHTGEDVVHYLIFDSNGYWKVYMNYDTLLPAIQQLPEQLVSFKVFCALQKSSHTGCYYEYVEDKEFTADFYIDADDRLRSVEDDSIMFVKLYKDSGEPNANVVAEARDLFDRALVAAHSK